MFKFKPDTTWIITFTLIILLTFIYLVVNFYQTALLKSKLNHQQQQLEMAKSAATGISSYLQHLESDMHLLSSIRFSTADNKLSHLDFGEGAIQSVFLADRQYQIIYRRGQLLPDWIGEELAHMYNSGILSDSLQDTPIKCQYSSVRPIKSTSHDTPYVFLMIRPYLPERSITAEPHPTYMGYVIRFDWLTDRFISPLRLTENDFAWIMDDAGRLIYHPNHNEMLLRSVQELNKDCQRCHKDFTVHKQMLRSTYGMDEYHIEGEPAKIMAYTSVQLTGQKWFLAISTFQPWVVKDVINTFLIVFILSGVFLLLLIIAGITFYFVNLKRIRAEEAQRHLAQAQSFQEKLNQAAKLASIGELVDSVAHEINTPTGIIATVTDTLFLQDCAKMKCAADLNTVREQVQRIKKYTRSLLGFSRRLPYQPEANNMVELIAECIFLVSPRLRAQRIKILKNIPADFPVFVFDRGRIEQVIINLLNNAIDFVKANGEIAITMDFKTTANEQDSEKWVCIAISDNGKGIPAEDIPYIFEPFFSTKPITKGTGLGLSISKTIIDRHNGKITVSSRPEQGSTFSIYLPFITN